MMVSSSSTRQGLPSWMTSAAAASSSTRVEFDGNISDAMLKDDSAPASSLLQPHPQSQSQLSKSSISDVKLGFTERAFSAAGAAVLSAILVNPLDVAKVLLLLIFNSPHCYFVFLCNYVAFIQLQ